MLGLVKEFPQLKVVLQDLPAVVQQGQDVSHLSEKLALY